MRWDQLTPVNWIIDSAMICRLRGDEIDWDAILIFARKHKVLVRLGLGLTYLHEEFQVQIPAKVLGDLHEYKPGWFERFENGFLLTISPHLLSGPKGVFKLLYFIVWRSMRMEHKWLLPINILWIGFHMIGNDTESNVIERLFHYGKK